MNHRTIKLTMILVLIFVLSTQAVKAMTGIGSAFSYQGELIDTGVPANGNYDMLFILYTNQTGNSGPVMGIDSHLNVEVVNGLFSIESIDFGDAVYEDSIQLYLEIGVKLSGQPNGVHEILSPRTRLSAVPYAVQAEFLAKGAATNGDILHLENNQWVATSRLSVNTNGKIGIGTTNSSDRLHINSNSGEHALRVQVDGQTKLRVRNNGGTSIGTNTSATPDNGLFVQGDTKQDSASNGMLKYMAVLDCGTTSNLHRSYNGTNVSGNIGVFPSIFVGQCNIVFPTDINTRYFVASALTTSGDSRVGCHFGGSSTISCTRSTNGTDSSGPITLLVY